MKPEIKVKPPGPKAKKVLEQDREFVSPSYPRAYPLVTDHGSGMWVWDVDGNKYLDFVAGVAVNSLGHSHPAIIEAIHEQSKKFIHAVGTVFYYKLIPDVCAKLCQITPGRFKKKAFLANSGAEAIEAAIKLARYTTGRPRIISFIGAFHGRTMGAISLTASKAVHRRHFSPMLPEVTHVPYAYCYRCIFNLEPKSCAIACIDYIEDWIFTKVAPPEDVAAIVVEPIQGEGGYVVPPDGYFQKLREICDKHKILLVVDEVQTGFGRTGKMFAIEHWGVEPDIICLAKGIAAGMPMGAMVAKESICKWETGAHSNTFGGNPLSAVACLKTIEILQDGLVEHAKKMGDYLHKKLGAISSKYDFIGDHRGLGLMQGIEIVKNRKTKEPDHNYRELIVNKCFEKGLLILGCGDSTIRFVPPLIVEKDHVDIAMGILTDVLNE